MSTLTASHGLTLSERGLRLIKAFEGFRPVDRTLVSGHRVVGYGHKLYDDAPYRLTKIEAETLLKADLEPYEDMINENVHAPLSQGQFDALVSFAFNIGPKAFLNSDTLQALNNGRHLDAANSFDKWRKSRVNGKVYVIDALMRRRTAEKALFLRTDKTFHPAPTVDLPPLKDLTGPTNVSDVLSSSQETHEVYDESWESSNADDRLEAANNINDIGVVPLAPIESPEEVPETDLTVSSPVEVLGRSDDIEFKTEIAPEPELENFASETAPMAIVTELEVDTPPLTIEKSEANLDEILELNAFDELIEDSETDLESVISKSFGDPLHNQIDDTEFGSVGTKATSSIAEAAADISDRLDALIENVRDEEGVDTKNWPENLIQSEMPSPQTEESAVSRPLQAKEGAVLRANTDVTTDSLPEATPENTVDIVIDNLAEDDAMRLSGKNTSHIFENEKEGSVKDRDLDSNSFGLWTILLIGLLILAASVFADIAELEILKGEWGPLLVLAGFTIGALMVLGAIYYLIKKALR